MGLRDQPGALQEDTLCSLRAAAEAITPQLSDMPKSQSMQDKLSKIVAQIVDLEKRIAGLKLEMEQERRVVTGFVEMIEDSVIKTIFTLRFVECMTWAEVASAVKGGEAEDSVKKTCYRYLKKLK